MFNNQRELRHGMINKISESIQAAVLSVGRTKEDLKKYTLNIEQTAWHNSKGDQVSVCAQQQRLTAAEAAGGSAPAQSRSTFAATACRCFCMPL